MTKRTKVLLSLALTIGLFSAICEVVIEAALVAGEAIVAFAERVTEDD